MLGSTCFGVKLSHCVSTAEIGKAQYVCLEVVEKFQSITHAVEIHGDGGA